MAHRAFGQVKENPVKVDPITFDLAGEEGIACRDEVNGKLLIELVGKVDSGNVSKQSEGILQVFGVCVRNNDGEEDDKYTGKAYGEHTSREITEAVEDELIPDIDPTSSLGRLNAVLNDPDTAITVDELAELVGWLVEQYTSRPTVSAKSSATGTKNSGRTSRRARRSTAELTSVPSTEE